MKTLLISDIFPPRNGGSGRWFREIYGRLSREEYVIAAGEDARQEEYDRTHDLRLTRVPLAMETWEIRSLRGLRGYGRAIRRLAYLARSERVGMVHAARCLPEGMMALALKKLLSIPYLCYVHGEDMASASTSRELSWLARRVLLGAEFAIANSRNSVQILRDGWGLPLGKIRMLHPGVDIERFVPVARDLIVRQELGWGDRPVVLTVGRLQRRKGHDQMILALDQIRRTIPNLLYAIVGGGEERDRLQDLVKSRGLSHFVQFLGELGDQSLVRCYQQCDLFVLPNRQEGADIEGFGMVLLEAQACGKAVVAGDSGGTAETMRIPETGRVVPCDGPYELAALVTELMSSRDQLAFMGEAARRWVVEQFDWAILSREAEQLFRCGPHGPRTSPMPLSAWT